MGNRDFAKLIGQQLVDIDHFPRHLKIAFLHFQVALIAGDISLRVIFEGKFALAEVEFQLSRGLAVVWEIRRDSSSAIVMLPSKPKNFPQIAPRKMSRMLR